MSDTYSKYEGFYYPGKTSKWVEIALAESADIDEIVKYVGQRRTVIHAGGNLGVWTRRYSQLFKRVYTFEPDPNNFDCLELNTKDLSNVSIYNVGLGKEAGSASVNHAIPGNTGAHQLVDGDDVPVVALENVFPEVDLLQLDVEGHEQWVLEGAEEMLLKQKPVVVLELKGVGLIHGISDEYTTGWLAERGYSPVARIKNDTVFVHGR